MITTKEFKTLHGLSDSAFNRLTNKIKAEYPDQELTRRVGSRDWKIIDIALFEQYLGYQKPEVPATVQPEASDAIDAEIVEPAIQSSIQLLDSSKLSARCLSRCYLATR